MVLRALYFHANAVTFVVLIIGVYICFCLDYSVFILCSRIKTATHLVEEVNATKGDLIKENWIFRLLNIKANT